MQKTIKYLLTLTFLGLGITTAQAETKYVTENLSTYLRKGEVTNIEFPVLLNQVNR